MYSDGNLTDVSVVEIEANDQKPFPEDLKSLDLFKKEKASTEGHSSGIGGSSCMSSSRQSVCSGEEPEATRSAASAVQYSTVVHSGYRHQVPSVQVFSRSESTQPLLDSEERPEELQLADGGAGPVPRQQYFRQQCGQPGAGPDAPQFEWPEQVSPGGEDDSVRLKHQQVADPTPQACGAGQLKAFPEAPAADASEGPLARLGTVGVEAALDEGLPKSYLPQTVRRGGYVPQ